MNIDTDLLDAQLSVQGYIDETNAEWFRRVWGLPLLAEMKA